MEDLLCGSDRDWTAVKAPSRRPEPPGRRAPPFTKRDLPRNAKARTSPPLRAASKTSALRQLSRAERADLLAVAPGTAGGGVVDRSASARFSTAEVRDALAGLEALNPGWPAWVLPGSSLARGVLVASSRCDGSPRISPVESLLWKGTCGCASGWVS